MSSPSPGIGQVLGHYRVIGKIGAGGMGLVYRAHDGRLDRDVAIKVLPSQALADEAARKRFRKEALTLSKLSHPNIATIYDFDTQDGIDLLVRVVVSGATRAQRVADGTLPEKEVLSLGIQIAQTLQDAHDQGLAHRDLKPGNIMVTPTGHVKLLDFGLARLFRADETATQRIPEIFGHTTNARLRTGQFALA
jgi:serine/threonine protein kinase